MFSLQVREHERSAFAARHDVPERERVAGGGRETAHSAHDSVAENDRAHSPILSCASAL